MSQGHFLPGVPADLIEAIYRAAPGNEIDSGKFASPESSAALAANAFGLFLQRPGDLPPLPGVVTCGWPARSVELEAVVRFPWAGGRHPCLDALIVDEATVIGIESKRFEPFRTKGAISLSDAYWRPVWGERMSRYMSVRDALRDGRASFNHLDAAQLIKHAFGLRTAVQQTRRHAGKRAVLFYLYAEPECWPGGGRRIGPANRDAHAAEVASFADAVSGDEVEFVSCSYRTLLVGWRASDQPAIRAHALAIAERFSP